MSYWYGKFEVATTQSPSVRTTSIACAVVSYSSSYCDRTARAMICLEDHGGLAAWREHYWCSNRASSGGDCGPAGTIRLSTLLSRVVPRLEAYESGGLPMSYQVPMVPRIVVPTLHTLSSPHIDGALMQGAETVTWGLASVCITVGQWPRVATEHNTSPSWVPFLTTKSITEVQTFLAREQQANAGAKFGVFSSPLGMPLICKICQQAFGRKPCHLKCFLQQFENTRLFDRIPCCQTGCFTVS